MFSDLQRAARRESKRVFEAHGGGGVFAAALRRVASHCPEYYWMLDVLEKTRDGRRARIAWARLVLQRNTIQLNILLSRGRQGSDRRELINGGFDFDLLRRGVDLGLGDLIR